ncbi:hypothetical protein NX059_008572 [Plenodomus lindquistii]|nr:hypothetical protein NX059_008572 [Plenodomus lindquistii]
MSGQMQATFVASTDLAIIKDLHDVWTTGTVVNFAAGRKLGMGSDGEVVQWTHLPTNTKMAVKAPRELHGSTRDMILAEIHNLKMLGAHDHIVHMITSNDIIRNPVICLELCEFGDVYSYFDKWYDQETAMGRSSCLSDITVWKLLKDASLGLDFIHNTHQITYVHTDLKPGNILVTSPYSWHPEDGLPLEPVFKITDFARLTADPPAPQDVTQHYMGTPEFAPPDVERCVPLHPAVDIWGLGATLQVFKTGRPCVISKQTYMRDMFEQGKSFPQLTDERAWKSFAVRQQRRPVYRPLNVSATKLRIRHDLPEVGRDYVPSSNSLEYAYRMLWHEPASERITSAALVKDVVPRIDREIAILKVDAQINESLQAARELQERVAARRAKRQ